MCGTEGPAAEAEEERRGARRGTIPVGKSAGEAAASAHTRRTSRRASGLWPSAVSRPSRRTRAAHAAAAATVAPALPSSLPRPSHCRMSTLRTTPASSVAASAPSCRALSASSSTARTCGHCALVCGRACPSAAVSAGCAGICSTCFFCSCSCFAAVPTLGRRSERRGAFCRGALLLVPLARGEPVPARSHAGRAARRATGASRSSSSRACALRQPSGGVAPGVVGALCGFPSSPPSPVRSLIQFSCFSQSEGLIRLPFCFTHPTPPNPQRNL